MKRLSNIFIAAAVGFMLTGCGLYDKYEQKVDAPADAFGTTLISDASTEGASLAQMSWREFFSDPLLQQLIEQVLANNTDVNSARIAVEKSEASLKMAKLAYLPSLYFAPQGTLASFDKSAFSKTYTLPLQLSMDVDVFGSITNKKRAAKAVLLQAQLGEEAVRSNLISSRRHLRRATRAAHPRRHRAARRRRRSRRTLRPSSQSRTTRRPAPARARSSG